MIYFKVPGVPEVFSPFRTVHYKELNGNPQMKSLWHPRYGLTPHLLKTNLALNLMQI